jgi:hypothetical protein
MRTTLDLQDALFREAKARAAERGQSLTSLIEEAVSQYLTKPVPRRTAFKLKLVTADAGLPPGLDVADRDALETFLSES